MLELTGIPKEELGFLLMPLVKIKVLNKSTDDDNFDSHTEVTVND